jgi:peroxiredoxin
MALKIGDAAPGFELLAISDQGQGKIRLSDYRGKRHVVVTFHPLDWTPT